MTTLREKLDLAKFGCMFPRNIGDRNYIVFSIIVSNRNMYPYGLLVFAGN
jgi:hypothetical protein